LAYAAHRLEHWNIASQFLVRITTVRWVTSTSDPNVWNFRVAPNLLNRLVTAAVWVVNTTPLGWPCWWVALAFGLVALAGQLPDARPILARPMLALAGSALLYDLGYVFFSVAAEFRYYCWPMMATSIAAVMFARHWRQTPQAQRPGRSQQIWAAAPLLVVTVWGLGWRWFG
jgi:hypothetical protein